MNDFPNPAWLPLLLLATSGVVASLAAQLSLAWLERTLADEGRARWRGLLAAGLAMGTGLAAVHGLGVTAGPHSFDVVRHVALTLALWLLGTLACAALLRMLDAAKSTRRRVVAAAIGMGAAVIALQGLGTLSSGALALAGWRLAPLLLAGPGAVGGCLLGFMLWQRLRRVNRQVAARGRWAAAVTLGLTLVASAQGVRAAAGLAWLGGAGVPGQSPSLLSAALALGLAGALLPALAAWLTRHRRAQHARVTARRQLGAQFLNDPLTRLPCRALFEGTLSQAVAKADASFQQLALLFINLDGFRALNQTYGHGDGDRVLLKAATRLRAIAPPHMAARLAGDEFVVLLAGNPSVEEASAFAAAVLAKIGRPLLVDGRDLGIACSVGVAMYPEHGAMSTMISHAEAAMRTAKAAGGACHALFDARMSRGANMQMGLLRDLRAAVERRQFELYYQPKIHAATGEITGAEALIRWHHPTRGMVSPADFISLAERYGLIGALGGWVIDEACRQAREWRDAGLRMRVAINLSMRQLTQPDLCLRIGAALQRHQINPDLITCEVTESSAMDDPELTIKVLGQLDALGVHLSIDDFGTGHSSLAYLRKLPADELKIDRSFVLDLETSDEARKVASAVVNLAKALNLKVVAEGVETEAQYHILREFGCDQLQGYLFAKPMSAKALARWAMEDVGPRTMNFSASLFKATLPAELQ